MIQELRPPRNINGQLRPSVFIAASDMPQIGNTMPAQLTD
jgi:hypothetical protein